MSKINYQIEFFSYWHCGSGLAAGADVDALVIKDKDGLPFIPGRTIKGLIKEAVETISYFEGKDTDKTLFGEEGQVASELFFSNATLIEADQIRQNNLTEYLFDTIANNRIDEKGITKKGSLRKTQVVVPCTLKGFISGVPDKETETMIIHSFAFIKSIGLHRNRGLGRCSITVKED